MKTLIIYFSMTGNTEKVAKYIRHGILDLADDCDIVKMENVDMDSLKDYDIVGFGCPVYYYKEPFNVSDFIGTLPKLNDKHWFIFCTHGAVMGITLLSLHKKLRKKGMKIIGSYHSYADINIPFFPSPTLTTGHPDRHDLEDASTFGKNIIKCHLESLKGEMGSIKETAPLTETWVENELPLFDRETISNIMPKLSINIETCTMCGECENQCPVNGIDTGADPPRIQDPCIYCWQCSVVCPVVAIETDWSMLVNAAPHNYERYEEALLEAEERGEFRWLMNRNQLDLDTPLHIQLKWKADARRHRK